MNNLPHFLNVFFFFVRFPFLSSQYFVDTKLDQVFHEFLVDLVTDEEFIPPNPYPRLASQLVVSATRWHNHSHFRLVVFMLKCIGSVLLTPLRFVCDRVQCFCCLIRGGRGGGREVEQEPTTTEWMNELKNFMQCCRLFLPVRNYNQRSQKRLVPALSISECHRQWFIPRVHRLSQIK